MDEIKIQRVPTERFCLSKALAIVLTIAITLSAIGSVPIVASDMGSFDERARALILDYAENDVRVPTWYDGFGNLVARTKADDLTGYAKSGVYTAMARFAAGDVEGGDSLAREVFQNPGSGSMFLVMAGMDLYLRYGEMMEDTTRAAIRRHVTRYSIPQYSGEDGTENHRMMYATGGYLAAETWDDWSVRDRVLSGARDHIYQFINQLANSGILEYGSPTYHVFFVACLLSLYDHAEDPEMRMRARMGLDILLSDVATQWLDGNGITSTLRTHAFNACPNSMFLLSSMGWLYFGGPHMPPPSDGITVMAAVSDYRPSELIYRSATDRSEPFVNRETQRSLSPNASHVRKYTFIDSGYGMYSQFEGHGNIGWSDQMQRWGVIWTSPVVGNHFTIKEYVSDIWWQNVLGETGDYRVLQSERALVGISAVNLIAIYPDNESIHAVLKADNWVFLHTGTALIGFYIVGGYEEDQKYMCVYTGAHRQTLRSMSTQNGFAVQTADVSQFSAETEGAELELFAEAVMALPLDVSEVGGARSRLTFTSLAGDTLEITFGGAHRINGEVVNYSNWPRKENPWMYSDALSSVWTMADEDTSYVYDFSEQTITATTVLSRTNLPPRWVPQALSLD